MERATSTRGARSSALLSGKAPSGLRLPATAVLRYPGVSPAHARWLTTTRRVLRRLRCFGSLISESQARSSPSPRAPSGGDTGDEWDGNRWRGAGLLTRLCARLGVEMTTAWLWRRATQGMRHSIRSGYREGGQPYPAKIPWFGLNLCRKDAEERRRDASRGGRRWRSPARVERIHSGGVRRWVTPP